MAPQMNRVNWFEIPVKEMERAKKFYETILGVKLSDNEMGPMKMAFFPSVENAPGATGSLVKAKGYTPSHNGSVVYFSVDSIDRTLTKVESHGGKTVLPKMAIGEWGFIAQFYDCEGNRVALHSMK
jgi:uncharacterized protein